MRPSTATSTTTDDRVEIVRAAARGGAAARAELWRDLRRPLPRIDSKYLYDDRGSSLFEAITRLPEYYQTRTEERLLETVADEVVATTDPAELVELGSGTGRKIRLLLDAGRRRGRPAACVLLDVNETFLASSARRLVEDYPWLAVRGVVGDFLHDLAAIGDGERRLFLFFAGTIGNLDQTGLPVFLAGVRAVMSPADHFLVGIDLVKDRARLEAAYNDSAGVTAAFNRNILRAVNRRFGTDFDPDGFDHVAFWDPCHEWIEMRLRARRDATVTLGHDGGSLRLSAGDEIRTEISRKFTRASFSRQVEESGLAVESWFVDPEELFALALLRAA